MTDRPLPSPEEAANRPEPPNAQGEFGGIAGMAALFSKSVSTEEIERRGYRAGYVAAIAEMANFHHMCAAMWREQVEFSEKEAADVRKSSGDRRRAVIRISIAEMCASEHAESEARASQLLSTLMAGDKQAP